MKINIYGSTGVIGQKSLKLVNNYPNIKINLLLANNNFKKLISQSIKYKPKYICIKNSKYYEHVKAKVPKNVNIIKHNDLNSFLEKNFVEISILAISGYNALLYFDSIINNSKFLGLVNKEVIVSAGHLFKKKKYIKSAKIFPIDSEHFSLFNFFNNYNYKLAEIKNVYLTASGGPFLNYNSNKLADVSVKEATNHPKWKMGKKNSIDSATLANKCLELIEAHYLFDIPYNKLKILIHPESLVHSIVEFYNGISVFNYFYNDMDIPLINFFDYVMNKKSINLKSQYFINKNFNLNFIKPDNKNYPIYKIFNKVKNKEIEKKIMFNVINENAVELFTKNKIKFNDISKYVNKYLSLDLKMPINNVNNIFKFQLYIKNKLDIK